MEQAINDLVERTLPSEKRFFSADNWRTWTKRLVDDLTAASDPRDQIKFGNPGHNDICTHACTASLLLILSVRTVVDVATPRMLVRQFVVRSASGAIPPAVADRT